MVRGNCFRGIMIRFIKKFLFNIVILVVLGLVLYIAFPDIMKMLFEIYGALFGPGIIILTVIVAALPDRRNR